ncbi:hypothetical protein [Nitratifractor sp.]|uniref:hypothetical protein n=1 Tax=Nitratifractor sp. TaxID=2268144 RepID=UPI0025D91477|nr:hypothetical protein [Nitratifractor sp.]
MADEKELQQEKVEVREAFSEAEAAKERREEEKPKETVVEPDPESPAAEEKGSESTCEIVVAPAEGDRHTRARKQVEAARALVESADAEIEECIAKIRDDLAKFEAYEHASLEPVVEESRRLLSELGVGELPTGVVVSEVELENPAEERLEIEDLPSGKAGAFGWGFLVALLTLLGWYLYGASRAGLSPLPDRMPDLGFFSAIAGKISLLIDQAANPAVGAAIALGTALLAGWIVYAVLVAMRAAKNQRIAEEIAQEAGFYCRKKEECKEKMAQVREHLKELQRTVQKYQVLLDEKNAALRRALFVEDADSLEKLHQRSRQNVEEIQELLQELSRLLATPMAREGMLTKESTETLRRAKRVINDRILSLYS